jgi:hypothetical protein
MKILQQLYCICFLIFASLSYFCSASENGSDLPGSDASSSDHSNSSDRPRGSKRSREVPDSGSFTLPDDETLVSWFNSSKLKKLKSLVKKVGLNYDNEIIANIARLAILHEKRAVLNVLNDSENMYIFLRLILRLTGDSDSVFGIEYLMDEDFEFSGLNLHRLVLKDAFKVVAAISVRIEDFNTLEGQLNPPSLLFYAKSIQMVRVLIDAGSSLTATDAFALTPLEHIFNKRLLTAAKGFPLLDRVALFRNNLLDMVSSAEKYPLSVDRDNVFAAAYGNGWFEPGVELNVSFNGEALALSGSGSDGAAIDGEGPFREFISLLVKDIFRSEKALFRPLSDSSFHYAPVEGEGEDKFRIAGSIVAVALRESIPLGVTFIPFIQKFMLNQEVTFEDMKDHEPAYYRAMTAIKNNPIYDFDAQPLYFESNPDRQVTRENFDEFLIDLAAERMINPYLAEVEAFLAGFKEKLQILSPQMLFTVPEFSSVLMGRVSLAADDFVPYFDPFLTHQIREFFLKFYREFADDELRLKVIEFATGCVGIPACGLESFTPRFTISPAVHGQALIDLLPRSSTCSNTLFLPPITDYDVFCAKFEASLNAPPFFGLN